MAEKGPANPRPILVTGAYRSGTTWVGRMLSVGNSVGYIHEPLSVNRRRGRIIPGVDKVFLYVCQDNEAEYFLPIQEMLEFKYRLFSTLSSVRQLDRIPPPIKEWYQFGRYRRADARPLVKDPFAVFSAEWMQSRLGTDTVVMIRHPAAFVSSLKKKGWNYRFDHLLQQPLLMRDHLEPFRAEIASFARDKREIVEQSTLLWSLIYRVVVGFRSRHPDWQFLRHEDVSRDPLHVFESLYANLGLDFGEDARAAIAEHSSSDNPSDPVRDSLMRNSLEGITTWKARLSPAEINVVRNGTEEVASEFYGAQDW